MGRTHLGPTVSESYGCFKSASSIIILWHMATAFIFPPRASGSKVSLQRSCPPRNLLPCSTNVLRQHQNPGGHLIGVKQERSLVLLGRAKRIPRGASLMKGHGYREITLLTRGATTLGIKPLNLPTLKVVVLPIKLYSFTKPFLHSSIGKESSRYARRPLFKSRVRKIPWRRERLPTPVFWPGEFHGLQYMRSQRVGHN